MTLIGKDDLIKEITMLRDEAILHMHEWQGHDHDSEIFCAGEVEAYNRVLKDILGWSAHDDVSEDICSCKHLISQHIVANKHKDNTKIKASSCVICKQVCSFEINIESRFPVSVSSP